MLILRPYLVACSVQNNKISDFNSPFVKHMQKIDLILKYWKYKNFKANVYRI